MADSIKVVSSKPRLFFVPVGPVSVSADLGAAQPAAYSVLIDNNILSQGPVVASVAIGDGAALRHHELTIAATFTLQGVGGAPSLRVILGPDALGNNKVYDVSINASNGDIVTITIHIDFV